MAEVNNGIANLPKWSQDELRELTPKTLFDTIESKNLTVTSAADVLGTGFTVLDDKDRLIGVPFYIVDWHVSTGDNGEFTSLLVLTPEVKIVVNDGGSGIPAQIQELEPYARDGIIFVPKGLRKSVFYYDPENVEDKSREQQPGYRKATTYYLAT